MTRVFVGTEKELLLAFLDQQRDVVVWKLDGLTDYQLRQRPLTPSGLYLLGVVKHLAGVEQYWLCAIFGRPAEPFSLAASDDLEVEEGDTTDSVLAYYTRARAASDRAITELDPGGVISTSAFGTFRDVMDAGVGIGIPIFWIWMLATGVLLFRRAGASESAVKPSSV